MAARIAVDLWVGIHMKSRYLLDPMMISKCRDRSNLIQRPREAKQGGGVSLAIRSRINSRQVFPPDYSAIEQLWIKAALFGANTFIGVIYLPPDRVNNVDVIEKLIKSLDWIVSQLHAKDNIIIIGDFNLRSITWQLNTNGFLYPNATRSSNSVTSSCLLDAFSTACLGQLNRIFNENGRLLDLCFVSKEVTNISLTHAPCPLVKDCRHHPPLLLSMHYEARSPIISASPNSIFYNFSKADYTAMNAFLTSVPWNELIRDRDVNLAASTVCNVLLYAIDQFVPKRIRKRPAYPAWSTRCLKRLKKLKKKALKKFSLLKTATSKALYLEANRKYKRLNKRLFHIHLNRLQRSLKSKPKGFWRYVNDQRKESGLPTSMYHGDIEASTIDQIASLFREQFSSVFLDTPASPLVITEAAENVPSLPGVGPHYSITSDIVIAAAKRLKCSSNAGPDGIPAVTLKNCINAIASPLASIFDCSLATGVFPSCWKNSYVFPVHKKGCKRSVSNYRGIAALNARHISRQINMKPKAIDYHQPCGIHFFCHSPYRERLASRRHLY
ncbi:uncharacterized protein LOC128740120 [Sabethes cyaneus]|uniref:uncharacterized protein LOC128740120 n=1 Tax=Sabethes cyaneus TaxID=53552 RepID=UPI00237E2EA2|nr:uncharacterized protein LOC128740120 [Sabethes cyaneus]